MNLLFRYSPVGGSASWAWGEYFASVPVSSLSWSWSVTNLGSLCLGLFLAMLDTAIVATCMYSIALEFESLDSINWVALAYTLAYLGCAVLFARVSDVIGRKAAFVTAFVIFIAFSLGCGFAQNMNQLIVFRAFQGLGGSGKPILPPLPPLSSIR